MKLGPWRPVGVGTQLEFLIAGAYGSAQKATRVDINFNPDAVARGLLWAEVRAVGRSDIGEAVSAQVVAKTGCGVGDLPQGELKECVDRYLHAHRYPKEPYGWEGSSIPSAARAALRAFRSWRLGRPISAEDAQLLTKLCKGEWSKLEAVGEKNESPGIRRPRELEVPRTTVIVR